MSCCFLSFSRRRGGGEPGDGDEQLLRPRPVWDGRGWQFSLQERCEHCSHSQLLSCCLWVNLNCLFLIPRVLSPCLQCSLRLGKRMRGIKGILLRCIHGGIIESNIELCMRLPLMAWLGNAYSMGYIRCEWCSSGVSTLSSNHVHTSLISIICGLVLIN